MKVVLTLVALLAASVAHVRTPAQSSGGAGPGTPRTRARAVTPVADLVAGLKVKDDEAADEAAAALVRRGVEVVPFLERFLKAEEKEVYRLRAAHVLARVEPDHPALVPTLLGIAKGRGLFDSEETLMVRRVAGMSLALTPAGLRALTALLKEEDAFVRRSAAFAFDERTEALDSLTPGLYAALGDALPALVAALDDGDEVVRGMSCEALGQLIRAGVEPLSSGAERLLKRRGKSRGRCPCECE